MKKIKIAILATTSVHATNYIISLPHHDSYEWVAASIAPKDRNIEGYKPTIKDIPDYVKLYETDEELLNSHLDLDAVILAGANEQTFGQFKECAERGIKNVLLMKVPTFDMEQYSEMQRLAKENDMIVQVELEMRIDQNVRRLKEILDSGSIGKLISIEINNTTVMLLPQTLPWVSDPKQSYGKAIPLRDGDSRFRGGCLTDHPHAFDLSRFFSESEFESIYADISPNFREANHPIEEGVFVIGKMKNGVTVTIDPSYSRHENKNGPIKPAGPGWEGFPKRVEVTIALHGDKGSVICDCFHSGIYHTGLPYNTYAYQYVGQFSHYTPTLNDFADSIYNHTQPNINLDMHKNNMKAVNACYESISTGKTVKL